MSSSLTTLVRRTGFRPRLAAPSVLRPALPTATHARAALVQRTLSTASVETPAAPNATTIPTCTSSSSPTAAVQAHSEETRDLIHRLRAQNKYYATVQIKGKHYTVTEGDIIITDRMAELALGDMINLECVTELGSRDFTVLGKPYVSTDFFTVRAVVLEHPVSSTVTVVKFKKRKDYCKTLHYNPKYTLLRVSKLDVNKLPGASA
ncbi:hypothetical protein IWQ60_001562 [Tieghemiomyces parasiticus]|uniref:Large ribosomal subunit protein bL21m n=1 Tax=Tieghemiomyces parasiticus TaxID=78921 RepID=A0A9W8DY67_9FUNG|nr:hypothetical protein IWQ60_001562 [Tieghemiomyces parasiticus]